MMGFAPRQLGYCSIAAVLWVFSIPRVFWPYLAGSAILLIGLWTAIVFGFEHFLFPHAAPGIPQENPAGAISMPSWIPGHVIWAYVTGAILIAWAWDC
jgi:hypothetical protein